jgi:putative transcriptional regulator
MKEKLGSHDERSWQEALKDLPKFMAGKPSSYRKIARPVPATVTEVKEARKAIHATQRRFASVVGVSVETVRAWEAGRRAPEGTASKVIRLIRKNAEFAQIFQAA